MDVQDWSSFWWNNITGANLVVSNVVDALLENSTVIIDVPSDLPWRQQMRSVIEDNYRSRSGSPEMIIDIIDAADECPTDLPPGIFLLQRFAQNREVRGGYRERSQRTIQDYLKEKAVLKNRVIWIKGLSGEYAAQWLHFCKDYCHDSPEYGLFVLEVHGGISKPDNKNIRLIRFLDCVSSYDVQLFSSFIVDDVSGLDSNWKKYISSAAASLCDTDAEITSCLLEEIDVKNESPIDIIANIANDTQYRMRGADATSNHVFSYSRRGNTTELEKRLWKAQVQTLFPIIEMERISIIEQYESLLQETLDNNSIEQYRIQIKRPIELELGTLCYMMSSTSLYIKERDVRDRIKFLHDCRNALAHAHCCSPENVKKLLDRM